MSNNLIPLQGMQVPAYMQQVGMTKEQIAAMNAGAATGTGGGGINKISLKQSRFRLVVGGQETMIIPALSIQLVAVRVNDYISKFYYEKEWNPNEDTQNPDCSSDDGIRPRADAPKPQCGPDGLCQNCPQNQWGSKINRITGDKIKACTDTKRLAIVAPGADARFANGGDLYQLSVPPASLKEWGTFVRQLASLPTPVSYNAVVVEVSFDPNVSYPKLLFKAVRYLEQDEFMAVYDRYDKEETKRVAGLADAQVMRVPVAQLSAPTQPVQQAPVQQQPVQQQQVPVQQAPVQQTAPDAGGWGNPAPVQQAPVQQAPVQQQPAPDAGGWGNPAPVQQAPVQQQPVQQQPVQQPVAETPATTGTGFTGQYLNGVPVMSGGRLYGKPSGDRSRRTKVEMAEDEAFDAQRQGQAQPTQVQQVPVQQAPVQQTAPVQQAPDAGAGWGGAPQQQAPVQQAPAQQQPAPDAGGWGNPAPVQQAPAQQAAPDTSGWGNPAAVQQAPTQPQAPAGWGNPAQPQTFDQSNPFAQAGAPAQQTGAPVQPGVVGGGDLNAAFAGWDDQAPQQ